MARPGIMYVHVAAAAQLVAQGKNPTIDSVREALGGTGSKSTIAPLLKRWKAAHQDTVAHAELGLPAELVLALKGVYETVQAQATLQVEQSEQTHREATAVLQEQLQQVFSERDALLNAQAQQSQALATAQARSQGLEETVQRQEITLVSLGSEKLGLEQRLVDRVAEIATTNSSRKKPKCTMGPPKELSPRRRKMRKTDHGLWWSVWVFVMRLPSCMKVAEGLPGTRPSE